METTSTTFGTRQIRLLGWPLALVLTTALLFGYYFTRTYVSPLSRQYQLDFGTAQWIEPPDPGPDAYFRKDIYLSALPQQAWIEVSASDNYFCMVNGHTVGNASSVKTRVAGIYDIKKRLKPGKNVIAVTISRTSFPGPAQLLVRGLIREPGKVTSILSDDSWKVTTRKGIVEGTESWESPLVDDERWPAAKLSDINRSSLNIRWVDTNPLLLQLQPAGKWLLAQNAATQAVFSGSFNAQSARQETWIQVASSGDLDLLVNGHLVTPAIPPTVGGKQLPHLAPAGKSVEEINSRRLLQQGLRLVPEKLEPVTLESYDISRWVRGGTNSLVATVRADHKPASFLADGFVVRGSVQLPAADSTAGPDQQGSIVDGLLRFHTDAGWQASELLPNGAPGEAKQAIEAGGDGAAPWGYLPQEPARPVDYPLWPIATRTITTFLFAIFLVVALWFISSALIATLTGETFREVMARDGLFHAPVIVVLLLLLLPGYDPRFPQTWPFQFWIILLGLILLLAVRFFHFLSAATVTHFGDRLASTRQSVGTYLEDRYETIRRVTFPQALPYIILAAIMLLGFLVRYIGHDFMSFDHDEMGLIVKSRGVYKLGFPYSEFAGDVRPLTTYELVPYPLALFGLIFGYNEWSLRLPAVIFGTLTIGVMAMLGRRLFNWKTGLAAAFIYACIPLNIRWAQNSFYPQQCQFMAMMSVWLFYEATLVRPLRRSYLTWASVFFCCTYLSWEGTAFLLPALVIGLIVIRWGEWWWLKDFHVYRCLFFIAAVVIAEYCYRTLVSVPYLQIGSGLSNLTGPSLFFLKAGYQPMYYVNKLLLSENHVFFTIMVVLGLMFCWNNRGFRYISTILITLVICHTNFLAALSPRYCYYYQAMLVLAGVGAAGLLYERLLAVANRAPAPVVPRAVAHVAGLGLFVLLFLQSNESVLKEYGLSIESDTPGLMTRMHTYRYDYRGAAMFVKAHLQPGDVVLPGIPHVYEFYSGIPGNYFLNTLLSSKVPYNQKLDEPGFVDKFSGLPVIRNLNELLEVTHRSRRSWLIFAPYASFEKLNDPAVLDYVNSTAKVMWESYRAKVLLIEGANQTTQVAQTP